MEDKTTDMPSADASEEAGLPPLWQRLLDAFFNPGKMGEYLAANPAWFSALLVVGVIIGFQFFLIPPEVFEAVQREAALEAGREPPEMSEAALGVIRLVTPIFAIISTMLFTCIFAGIYTFVFAFILGDEGKFKQYLSILAHASIITAVVGLAMTPFRISTSNPQLTVNMASFFFFLEDGYLIGVLTAIDLSQVWATLIVAMGATKIDSQRSFGSAAGVLLGFVLVIALIVGRFI